MNNVFGYSGAYSASTLEKTIPNGGSFNFKAKDENGCIDSIMAVTTQAIPSTISTANYSSASYIVPQKNDWFYMKDGNSKAIIAVKSSGSYLGKVSTHVYVDASASDIFPGIDWGFFVGAGAEYPLSKRIKLAIDAQYTRGLAGFSQEDEYVFATQNFTVGLSFIYVLKGYAERIKDEE